MLYNLILRSYKILTMNSLGIRYQETVFSRRILTLL